MSLLAIKRYINKVSTIPFHVLLRKAGDKIGRMVSELVMRRRDTTERTYSDDLVKGEVFSHFKGFLMEEISGYFEGCEGVLKNYFDHRFDLLGSGWVRVYHGMKCRGLEGYRYDMGVPIGTDSEGKWLEGRINVSNLPESKRIWRLVDPGYTPIDWHLDFKSGYRWSEDTWYKAIKYGHKMGVDIKVPWELARMQHLPQLAIAYALGAQSARSKAETNGEKIEEELQNQKPKNDQLEKFRSYPREFRNQTLDFMATNPPRFGVNWVCAMDVAIRAANWLMAYDIFRAAGVTFDEPFDALFSRSVFEHGIHIVRNMEWHDGQRGNHYLADIAGLAFIAAHLESNRETDAWLAFSVQELVTEVGHQFYPDGGNFEGSTAYHRLSAEMVYYATALVLGLSQEKREALKHYDHKAVRAGHGKPQLKQSPIPFYNLPEGSVSQYDESPFPLWYFERMERMSEFIMDITKPNGHIPQIGDNDSGRFFKFDPKYEFMTVEQAKEKYANLDGYTDLPDDAEYYMEDHLDCSHLVASGCELFDRADFAEWTETSDSIAGRPDQHIIMVLTNSHTIGSQRYRQRLQEDNTFFSIGMENDLNNALERLQKLPSAQIKSYRFNSHNCDISKGLALHAYPDFGLYLFTSPEIYLVIRCWAGKKPFFAAHMHNDPLSVEVSIKGRTVVADPGSYIYTALPDGRNRYRSVRSHFSPHAFLPESNNLLQGLFELPQPTLSSCIYLGTKGSLCCSQLRRGTIYRWIDLEKGLALKDFLSQEPIGEGDYSSPPFSAGYGIAITLKLLQA